MTHRPRMPHQPCTACDHPVRDDVELCTECGRRSTYIDRYRRHRFRVLVSRVSALPIKLSVAFALAATLLALAAKVERGIWSSPPQTSPVVGAPGPLPPRSMMESAIGPFLGVAVFFALVALLWHPSLRSLLAFGFSVVVAVLAVSIL